MLVDRRQQNLGFVAVQREHLPHQVADLLEAALVKHDDRGPGPPPPNGPRSPPGRQPRKPRGCGDAFRPAPPHQECADAPSPAPAAGRGFPPPPSEPRRSSPALSPPESGCRPAARLGVSTS